MVAGVAEFFFAFLPLFFPGFLGAALEWDGWDVGVGGVGRDGSGVAASSC